MAGRKKDYVWQDVTLTEDDKASCNYCDAVISKRPIRIENGGSSSGKNQWKVKTMIKLNGPHLWLTYTAVHQVQLHLRDGFQHLDLFGVKQEIDLVKRKPWNWLKFTEPWDLMTPNPFSFLHTFSFFLYFHMLSSSLYLEFNIHYYIITWHN